MTENATSMHRQVKAKVDLSWLVKIFFSPRQTIEKILKFDRAVWLAPLLVLSITALILVLVTGSVKQRIGLDNPAQLPQYFEYYSPEQQAQFMQALQATSGTAFVYVLPGLLSLAKVWFGWLIVGSLVYMMLTALGSGIHSRSAINLVAWASMPFALRDLVRALAVLSTGQLIRSPGLAGFTPAGSGNALLFFSALLALIDIYWVWQVVLITIGAYSESKGSKGKTAAGIVGTMLIILLLQALIGFGIALLGSRITAVQVFF